MKITIADLPTFVLAQHWRQDRLDFMVEQMERWEIDYELSRCIEGEPLGLVATLTHMNAIKNGIGRTPFVILEDDCWLRPNWAKSIELPNETRLFYPGHSTFGIASPGEPSWGREDALLVERHSKGLLRVRNMLGAHAIVYLDDDIAQQALERLWRGMFRDPWVWINDIALATLHLDNLVLTSDQPMCYQAQSVGGQESATSHSIADRVGRLSLSDFPLPPV